MNDQNIKYFKARLDMFSDVISKMESKNPDTALLRNGVFPKNKNEKALVKTYQKQKKYSNKALSFTEICSFNTWFNIYPEKICGQEIITSSIEFPLTIKGNKESIINTINKTIEKSNYKSRRKNSNNSLLISNLEIEALAIEYELQIKNL